MEIIIKEQSPDGLNITINNIVVDTYEEATTLLELIDSHLKERKEKIINEVMNPITEATDWELHEKGFNLSKKIRIIPVENEEKVTFEDYESCSVEDIKEFIKQVKISLVEDSSLRIEDVLNKFAGDRFK